MVKPEHRIDHAGPTSDFRVPNRNLGGRNMGHEDSDAFFHLTSEGFKDAF
jgi:hypothetical protein